MRFRLFQICLLSLSMQIVLHSKAQLFYSSGTFRVISAESASHFPGVAGAPIAHTVSVVIVMKRNTQFLVDSFWYNGFVAKAQIGKRNSKNFESHCKKGDTLDLRFTYYEATENDNFPAGTIPTGDRKAKPPVAHKGKLLFQYGFSTTPYFYSIRNIKKGQNVYAP